jgi:hypothetical protein
VLGDHHGGGVFALETDVVAAAVGVGTADLAKQLIHRLLDRIETPGVLRAGLRDDSAR